MSNPYGPFKIIYADPPQQYNDRKEVRKDGGKAKAGIGASGHYETMPVEDMTFDVHSVAARDCLLFVWGTGPLIWEIPKLVNLWNALAERYWRKRYGRDIYEYEKFKYATRAFVWVKKTKNGGKGAKRKSNNEHPEIFFGPGSWTAQNAEDVFLYTRGKTGKERDLIINKLKTNQIVFEPHPRYESGPKKGKIIHSRKPDCVRDRIIKICPDEPRLEMFSTQHVPGWFAFGKTDSEGNPFQSDIIVPMLPKLIIPTPEVTNVPEIRIPNQAVNKRPVERQGLVTDQMSIEEAIA